MPFSPPVPSRCRTRPISCCRRDSATASARELWTGFQGWVFCPLADQLMGRTAETLAEQYQISRTEQDGSPRGRTRTPSPPGNEWLLKSRCAAHRCESRLKSFSTDEPVRARRLRNSRGSNRSSREWDSSRGQFFGAHRRRRRNARRSESAVKKHKATPLARIVDYTVVGVDPKTMGIGPVPAVRRLIERTKIDLDQIDLIEINEAFAAQFSPVSAN